jgi:ferrous iron transport protein A
MAHLEDSASGHGAPQGAGLTQAVVPAPKALAELTLADLTSGQRGIVVGFAATNETLKRRLTALGVIRGTEIILDRTAPMGNPRAYSLMGYQLSLRNEDARSVLLRVV